MSRKLSGYVFDLLRIPKPDRIVINTSPLIALVAALGDLSLLETLYEILTGDSTRFE